MPPTKATTKTKPQKTTEEQTDEEKSDTVKEGRKWANIAKQYVGESRNLRTDLKNGLIKAINELYRIIKTGEGDNGRRMETTAILTPHAGPDDGNILKKLEAHGMLLQQHQEQMKTLTETIARTSQETNREEVLENIGQLKKTTTELAERVTHITNASPTYANALHRTVNHDTRSSPHFAVIVSSDTIEDGSGELMKKVRTTLEAKEKFKASDK